MGVHHVRGGLRAGDLGGPGGRRVAHADRRAVAGGVAYAWAGRRWWHSYQGAPAEHSRGEPTLVLVAAGVLALVLLVAVVALR